MACWIRSRIEGWMFSSLSWPDVVAVAGLGEQAEARLNCGRKYSSPWSSELGLPWNGAQKGVDAALVAPQVAHQPEVGGPGERKRDAVDAARPRYP
jgi:hypothetical protein